MRSSPTRRGTVLYGKYHFTLRTDLHGCLEVRHYYVQGLRGIDADDRRPAGCCIRCEDGQSGLPQANSNATNVLTTASLQGKRSIIGTISRFGVSSRQQAECCPAPAPASRRRLWPRAKSPASHGPTCTATRPTGEGAQACFADSKTHGPSGGETTRACLPRWHCALDWPSVWRAFCRQDRWQNQLIMPTEAEVIRRK
jgi:hypothetical protein